jgi:hypothetical protein
MSGNAKANKDSYKMRILKERIDRATTHNSNNDSYQKHLSVNVSQDHRGLIFIPIAH